MGFERFRWAVFIIACVILFYFYLIKGFISNCIFEWPIRWDITTCWNEQIIPAQQKAIETASPLSPL
ncbi:MAG: hypothetical protein Q8L01_02365 [Candidatus Woesebacteria bacterium]|nr:hypothetical protein [Candidatus Woesebacteria bacterium]